MAAVIQITAAVKLLNATQIVSLRIFRNAIFWKNKCKYVQFAAFIEHFLLVVFSKGKDARSAYGLCRYWRSVCVMFTGLLLCDIVLSLRGKNFFAMSFIMCNMMIRTAELYIVQHFMNELDASLRSLPIHHPHPNHLISVPVHFHIPVDGENNNECRYVHFVGKLCDPHKLNHFLL